MNEIFENDNLLFPDYNNSILNISALIAKIYGVNTSVEPTNLLNFEKLADKKNIIFIILDGFGLNLIRHYKEKLPFLSSSLKGKVTSVFPSTTASAITSVFTGKLPAEHGVIGWALYFKEFHRTFDYLPMRDSATNEQLSEKIYDYFKILSPDAILSKIHKKNPKLNLGYLSPKRIKGTPYNKLITKDAKIKGYKKESSMLKKILGMILSKKRNLIIGYSVYPDSLEHHHGTTSKEVEDFLTAIDKDLKKFYKNLPENSGVIISADHGLTDIEKFYIINDDTELFDSLIMPPFLDSRFLSFFVKPHKEEHFRHAFAKYEEDFILFSREEFIELGFLGEADYHHKLDDFIGNFIAIATGNKAFRYRYWQKDDENKIFKAHHSGLTKNEMEVPLFYFEK